MHPINTKGRVATGIGNLRDFAMLLAAAFVAGSCADAGPTSPSTMATQAVSEARGVTGFAYTTINPAGALMSAAEGINASGAIVGYYVDPGFVFHGFVWRDGEFTTIDYPGAAGTDARGIGPNGEIIGNFWLAGEPAVAYHGYKLTIQGEFIPVHYPGHSYEILQRILPDGTILGCRHDNNTTTTMKGVTIALSGNSEISQMGSMTNGGTPDLEKTVGQYMNTSAGNRTEGFIIDDGVFTPIMVPGSTMSNAWDINAGGLIAGVYNLSGFHGFVLTAGDYSTMMTLDVPGATATRAFGINSSGDVVGSFVQGGKTYGFLARGTHGKTD